MTRNEKKALIFIEDGSFSFDNRVIREANALIEHGWQVTVICPKYSNDPFHRKYSDKLHAYFYPKPTTHSALGHAFELAVSLTLGTALTLWVSLRHGFKVFHACNPMDALWIVGAPYKWFGRKVIFDQHDLCPELYLSREEGDEDSFLYRVLMWLEHQSYRVADLVIAPNESYKEIAVDRGGVAPDKVYVVRNGPDLQKFRRVSTRPDLTPNGETLVGYLGNMNLQDGVDHLVKAARIVLQQRKDIRFVFVGGGAHQGALTRMAEREGLGDAVTFTGRVPDEEMLATLCACDICVQPDPSNPLNEVSTMNKVLEYMALEIPVLAFDLKETRVSCGDAALYATPNEISDLADKIMLLADSPGKREEMARTGCSRVKSAMAWSFSVPHLIRCYDAAVTTA